MEDRRDDEERGDKDQGATFPTTSGEDDEAGVERKDEADPDKVDAESEQSFPASDPPAW